LSSHMCTRGDVDRRLIVATRLSTLGGRVILERRRDRPILARRRSISLRHSRQRECEVRRRRAQRDTILAPSVFLTAVGVIAYSLARSSGGRCIYRVKKRGWDFAVVPLTASR